VVALRKPRPSSPLRRQGHAKTWFAPEGSNSSDRRRVLFVAATLVSTFAPNAHAAEAYPSRPIRIVVGYAAGGPNDIIARALGQKFTETLGQQTIVDNRPGADGVIGADYVAKSPADGYTLLLASPAHAIKNAQTVQLPFDPVKSFAPISLVASGPIILVIHPSVPARSVKELISLAKARPGQLTYASSGTGGTLHLAGELFKSVARVDIVHVPYKGAAPATMDVVGGQVHIMFSNTLTAFPQMKTGRLRALAVSAEQRLPAAPDIPTFVESGLPTFEVAIWQALLAPAGTPTAIVERLSSEVARIVQLPDIRERLAGLGSDPVGSSPRQFTAYLEAEIAKYTRLIREANLKLE
jgi:tripartite-type tricarboxylate transporter receptor subunit TctC